MKKIIGSVIFIGFFLYVFAETNYLNNKNIFFENLTLTELILGSLGVAAFVFFFPVSHGKKPARLLSQVLKVLVITSTVFIILVEALIVDFSGIGFGPEVITHLNWDAFVLGVKQYKLPLLVFIMLTTAINVFILGMNKNSKAITRALLLLISIILIGLFFNQTIYGRLYEGYIEYNKLMNIRGVHESEIKKLKFIGIDHIKTSKSNIVANTNKDKNLIVIYLESFSALFVGNPNYPDLTPKFDKMAKQHHLISPYISTAHYTMDGLISSHCGFIPNMLMGNNTLASGERYYYDIPCFTDVLSVAGYHQEFLGGAKKSFAGKGDFLSDHGYDKVWGSEDFYADFGEQMTWWGLEDSDLFDQAKSRVHELQQLDQPYHLSLLTLGTHLKGYPSPSCPKYKDSEDLFINAIHCTDYLVGDFLDYLVNQGLLTNTTVIITGDHTLFSTSYTQDLFGNKIDDKNLFGLIIDEKNDIKTSNMGLYDLPPTILSLLEVDHNVSFIMGDEFGREVGSPMLTRNELYINGKAQPLSFECQFDLNKKVKPGKDIDLCDQRAVIHQLYGYTERFNIPSKFRYKANSVIEILYEKDYTKIVDITIGGNSLKPNFRNNGFVLTPEMYGRKGLFLININHQTQIIEHMLNFSELSSLLTFLQRVPSDSQSTLLLFGIDVEENRQVLDQLKVEYKEFTCQTYMVCIKPNENHDNTVTDKNNQRVIVSGF
ncbi:LTA synthase family protein [Marinicella sp. S1101]|uniref:LTA synthase family protein n=1 Tax=Marinicella marina TaxID=2996016 RepID=UPI002260F7BB|nr:LTA synthase family protein [Marinicella marina]MCX7553265.1 LTA synthase family protein [Marinicella marina]MDJ1138997.1 LTA synthase family protein [Marinicella marina]